MSNYHYRLFLIWIPDRPLWNLRHHVISSCFCRKEFEKKKYFKLNMNLIISSYYRNYRYLVISRPLDMDRRPTRSWAYFMSLLTWLYSILFASLPFFGVGKYVPEGYLTGCSFDYLSNDLTSKIFILNFFFGAWMVPMIIILFSYLSIIRCVAQSRRTVTHMAGNSTIYTIYYNI